MRYIVLPNPPYSPDLAPPYFHLFGPLKDTLRGRRFVDDDELRHRLREELRRFCKEVYSTDIQRLMQRWKKCLDNGGFVGKCPQLCKKCTHDICKFHYSCEEKKGALLSCRPVVLAARCSLRIARYDVQNIPLHSTKCHYMTLRTVCGVL